MPLCGGMLTDTAVANTPCRDKAALIFNFADVPYNHLIPYTDRDEQLVINPLTRVIF